MAPKRYNNTSKKTTKQSAVFHRNEGTTKSEDGVSLPSHLLNGDKKKQATHGRLDVQSLYNDAVFVGRRFLLSSECQAWIDHVESHKELEPMNQPGTRYVAQRTCARWQRHDIDMAQRIFRRLREFQILNQLPKVTATASYKPIACNPNLRLYKYERGMSFGKHYDDSVTIPIALTGKDAAKTEWTVLIYLSDCGGGATRFYPPTSSKSNKSFAFVPEQGAVLLHIHGDHCLQHEAEPVEQGIKYVLRTDLVYGNDPAI